MELKVWVDGVVRVVCGLSEETSCQDVVIALAQAIGKYIGEGTLGGEVKPGFLKYDPGGTLLCRV